MPKVSVIMPVYNGAKHIREAIDSVLAQTFQDWDFWIINEFGSNDGSAEIVSEYAQTDERFHLVQNQARLGLAESLNTGFRLAQGTYFARLDADDTAHPERFARQVALMENHPEVGICGTWQHHFGPNEDWVHCPPASADKCRARLLFNCDLCHSTLMLRREVVLEHQLFYDNSFGAEDYELWCRAVWVTDIVNIPEVLGEYRVGDGNITADKEAMLDIESGQLVARNLEQSLDIHLTEDEAMLFRGWSNPFDRFSSEEREAKLTELERILRQIYKHNTRRHAFDDTCLLEVLATKWRWAKYHAPWDAQYEVKELNQIFDNNYQPSFILRYKEFCAHNTTLGSKIKKIITVCLRPLARPFRTRIEGLLDRLEKNVCDYIEDKTWDRYLRLSAELRQTSAELQARQAVRLEMRMQDMAQVLIQRMDSRVWQAEQALTQSIDGRIWQAEQALTQSTDSRIWQAEQALTQSTDSRIWQAEQALTQSTDSRIWQAEQALTQSTDSRIWQAEQALTQSTDSRIWQAEQALTQSTDSSVERWTWDRYTRSKRDQTSQTWNIIYGIDSDKAKNIVSSSATYDLAFYWNNQYNSINSAQRILHPLLSCLPHQSVVDFGCGTGTWLWVTQAFGAQKILGIDRDYVPKSLLMIPQDCFLAANLEHPIALPQGFDLAMSLEVAEHLSPEAADDFVDSLCSASEVILFSAAHPGQNGDGHVNEQPLEYWIRKFEKRYYKSIEIRQYFRNDNNIETWYRDNLILFVYQSRHEDIANQLGKLRV